MPHQVPYKATFDRPPDPGDTVTFGDTTYDVRAAEPGEEPTRELHYLDWTMKLEGAAVVCTPRVTSALPPRIAQEPALEQTPSLEARIQELAEKDAKALFDHANKRRQDGGAATDIDRVDALAKCASLLYRAWRAERLLREAARHCECAQDPVLLAQVEALLTGS